MLENPHSKKEICYDAQVKPLVPPYRSQVFYNPRNAQLLPEPPVCRVDGEVNTNQNSYALLNLNHVQNQVSPIPRINDINQSNGSMFNLPNSVQDDEDVDTQISIV